jgi:3-phenylpropionate/trans-cinnamate dioxygenase ferredoxin reductase subunit
MLPSNEMANARADYLLIGGGLAAGNCARWLRQEGAGGTVMVVGREPDPPYNRPELSKGYLRGEETRAEVYFRPDEWWTEQDIDLRLRTSVTGLDLDARRATLSTREEIDFDKALIATGANVRRLTVDGCDLEGIHYLRSFGNSDAIRDAASTAHEVVLIGGSFIGCEVAASLTAMGKHCTIVMPEQYTLENVFGARMGRFFHDSLRDRGVTIHGNDTLERFEGDGHIRKVVTKAGLELDADVAVVGVGVMPETQLGAKAGIAIGERHGLRCTSRLETSVKGVYAAGDMCEYESVIHGGAPIRVEHWDVAFNQGKTAALNMLGRDIAHETVPYFYSVLAGIGELEYVGPAPVWDEEVLRGEMGDMSGFTNWYLRDGRVVAALTWGRPDDLDTARRLLSAGTVLDEPQRTMLADPDVELARVG